MATAMPQESICSLVKDRTLELQTEAGSKPFYNGIVVTEDILLVIDAMARNLKLYRPLDGKMMSSHRPESIPMDVCLISKTKVAVCLYHSKILILSFKSIDDVKRVKTLDVKVRTGFDVCHSVAKWNSGKLIVSGVKLDGVLSWCVVNLTDGRVDSTHKVCKGGFGSIDCSHLAIKNNTVYISCRTSDSNVEGVYAYAIFNPHTPKFRYRHDGFSPNSIMVDERNFIYVCGYNSIHQLTDSGQLVTIHTVSSSPYGIFYDDQHGVLYTIREDSNVITVYRLEYSHHPGDHNVREIKEKDIRRPPVMKTSTDLEQSILKLNLVRQVSSGESDVTAYKENQSSLRRRALPPGKKYHAFFSYSSSDMSWVKKTVETLEKEHGFVCCEYDRDNTPGTSLLKFASDSIRDAYKTVVVMTKEAFQSGFVLHEFEMAIINGFNESRKCVVPVLLEDCEVPVHLNVLNYIDVRDPTKRNIWWPKFITELENQGDHKAPDVSWSNERKQTMTGETTMHKKQ